MTSAHRIGYIGNWRPTHSTENHVGASLEANGHQVVRWQENTIRWEDLPSMAATEGVDFVLWTRTWHWSDLAPGTTASTQLDALEGLRSAGVPSVGYHLDRWWGLDREHQVKDEPFFRCDLVCTADGDLEHAERFADAGVNHRWFSPAVFGAEARRPGRWREEFACDVAFVGSWASYHAEWPQRMRLIGWLRQEFERHGRLRLFGAPGKAVRGRDLADVYASAKVVMGDSCLTGGIGRYWSDRIPETLGRGGFLIHPYVEGIETDYTPDEHLITYEAGDFGTLRQVIDTYCRDRDERERIATAGRAHVLAHHTYEHRMQALVDLLHTEGLVVEPDAATGRRRYWDGEGRSAVFDLAAGTTDALVVNEVWRSAAPYGLTTDDVAGRPVVDIGAGVGAFTVWASVAGASEVHAVEPVAATRDRLARNVRANRLGEEGTAAVTVWAGAVCGVVAEDDPVGVVVSDGERAAVVFRDRDDVGAEPVPVLPPFADTGERCEGWSLDEVLERLATPGAVVKLDAGGVEYEAVCDLRRWDLVDVLVVGFLGHTSGTYAAVVDTADETWHPFGDMVEVLAEHGTVTITGRPSAGGMLTWRRYR